MTIPNTAEAPDTHARWRKSSYSGSGNNCVEVAQAGGTAAVRDSKNPGSGHLTFGADAWEAFITDIKRGTYDL
jgi:hypothetical protein